MKPSELGQFWGAEFENRWYTECGRGLEPRFGGKSLFDAARNFSVVEFIKQVDQVNFGVLSSKIVGIQSVGGALSLVLAFEISFWREIAV